LFAGNHGSVLRQNDGVIAVVRDDAVEVVGTGGLRPLSVEVADGGFVRRAIVGSLLIAAGDDDEQGDRGAAADNVPDGHSASIGGVQKARLSKTGIVPLLAAASMTPIE
jgi:hypothetical protein